MVQKQEILNSLKQIILNRDTTLSPSDVTALSSLKHDLKLDSLDIIEIIKEYEDTHKNIFIENEHLNEFNKAYNLSEFAQIFYDYINHNNVKKMTMDELVALKSDDIFNIIAEHFYKMYDIPYAKKESNIYKDFNFTEFERAELYEWIEKQFQIQLPIFLYSNLDLICQRIQLEIKHKAEKQAFRNKMQKLFTKKEKTMKTTNTYDNVVNVLKKLQTKPIEITKDTKIQNVMAGVQMPAITLWATIQNKFDVNIDPYASSIKTVNDLCLVIEHLVKEKEINDKNTKQKNSVINQIKQIFTRGK